MTKQKNWHPAFVEYMKYIANHKNYEGMPDPYYKTRNGSIKVRWVVSGNTELGKRRAKWWDDKVKAMGLANRAEVARAIHPKELEGFKPCQICGQKLSIFYVYPNKNTLKKLENKTGMRIEPYRLDLLGIFNLLYNKYKTLSFKILREVFNVEDYISDDELVKYILENRKTMLSPGVMSNAPDRFDGFHTYNACCRSVEDTGRHIANLSRYTQDRRAYENWAEGNWSLSNRLMGEFNRFNEKMQCPVCNKYAKMTADHIGPISLGFTHRAKFNPMCKACNSKKNNRLTLEDVKTLIQDELNGEKVISWHSKCIWDMLKNKIKTEDDALKLSKAMRTNLHCILTLLAIIKARGHGEFLQRYLHPEYAFKDYMFENFHPLRLDELKIIEVNKNSKNKRKNKERYIRISLESLDEYIQSENRRVRIISTPETETALEGIISDLDKKRYDEAHKKLSSVIELLAKEVISEFFLDS